jgi:hypothetical protein
MINFKNLSINLTVFTFLFVIGYFVSRNLLYLYLSLVIIWADLVILFEIKKFDMMWAFIICIPLIILQGLSLVYWYSLRSIYLTDIFSNVMFGVFILIFLFILGSSVYFIKKGIIDNYQ